MNPFRISPVRRALLGLALAAPLAFVACKDNTPDPQPVNEDNELITTVRYTLTPTAGGGAAVYVQFRDVDGDGGTPPVVTSTSGDGKLTLRKNTAYTGRLLVLDESKTPVDTTSNEIRQEANDHLFVFTPAPAALLTVTLTDRDAHSPPLPVGLETTVQTQASAGAGTLKVALRHQPGVKNGTATPGDTDVEVDFPVVVTD